MYDLTETHRVFLAIIPPQDVRSSLRDAQRQLKKYARNFRFVPLDQSHITLQFLGNGVSGHSITVLEDNLGPLISTFDSFTLTIDKLNFGFHSQTIARVLFYSMTDDSKLNEIVSQIHQLVKELELSDINRKKDHAKLINHLTIARTKSDTSRSFSREIREAIKTINFKQLDFRVDEIKLIESKFKDNQTVYTTLATFPLKDKG